MTAKKRLLKLGALLAALLLIAAIAGVAASFLGDPVSAAIAQKGIDRYLRQQYPHSQLQVKKPVYNFKLGRYTAQVQDPDHVDAHFSVEWKPHFFGGSVCSRGNGAQIAEKTAVFTVCSQLPGRRPLVAGNWLLGPGGHKKGSSSF